MWRFGGDSSSPALARVPLNGSARSGCQASTCQTERARHVVVAESGCLRVQPKVGGKLHLRLNT